MKTTPFLLLATALLAGCQSGPITPPVTEPARVTVNFEDQDKFTDVSEAFSGNVSQGYLDEIASHVVETATPRLPEGQKLAVTFTDIDLAGEIRPERADNVRIIRAINFPRMKLRFTLTDAAGVVRQEGERRLLDMNFQMNIGPTLDRGAPLFYDKFMLTEWVQQEFKL